MVIGFEVPKPVGLNNVGNFNSTTLGQDHIYIRAMTKDEEGKIITAALADYSQCLKRIACLEHSLRQQGNALSEVGKILSGNPTNVGMSDPLDPSTFLVRPYGAAETKRYSVDLATISRHLQDLEKEIEHRGDLETTLRQTEHAHMIQNHANAR